MKKIIVVTQTKIKIDCFALGHDNGGTTLRQWRARLLLRRWRTELRKHSRGYSLDRLSRFGATKYYSRKIRLAG